MSDDIFVIDGSEIRFEEGETVLEAAARSGIDIPTLCYDPRLDPAGACRMCHRRGRGLAPHAACLFVSRRRQDMVVRTQTPRRSSATSQLHRLASIWPTRSRTREDDGGCNNPSKLCMTSPTLRHGGRVGPRSRRYARRGVRDDNAFIAYRPDRCILCSLCTRYCDEVEAVSAITLSRFRGAETTIATADARRAHRHDLRALRWLHRRLPDRGDDREAGARLRQARA